jgi:hypothetical protein
MILVLTSLYLFTNFIVGFLKKYYVYALIFFTLTFTSIINHTTHHPSANQIDLTVVWSVGLYGAYHLITHMSLEKWYLVPLILFFFSGTVIFYYYGRENGLFCFDKDPILAKMYHGYLHIVGSIAHHLIMAL